MPDCAAAEDAVFRAIDELSRQRPKSERLERSRSVVLSGRGAHLDSLALVSFLLLVEQNLAGNGHDSIVLTDDDVLAQHETILRTTGSFIDYLSQRLRGSSADAK